MPLISRPLALLFGTYRSEVLAALLLRPEESLHVREIARITGVPAGSLHRELRVLADLGLLTRESLGNQVRYRANRDFPIYAELAEIFRKTAGLADVVRDALSFLKEQVRLAFVFGSMAAGKERGVSDVDIFIVGDVSFPDAVKALSVVQTKLGREVNPVVMSPAELRQKADANDRFVMRVANEPKIFVFGSEDDFRELTQDRAAQRA